MSSSWFLILSIITIYLSSTTAQQPDQFSFTVYTLRPLASYKNYTSTNDLSPIQTISQYTLYVAKVGWGTPVQSYNKMIMDTGSFLNWIQCEDCILPGAECHKQDDPFFRTTYRSNNYKLMRCNTHSDCPRPKIIECTGDHICGYLIEYADNSTNKGVLGSETVSFLESGSIPNIVMGCGSKSARDFGNAAGILGLGTGPLAFSTQINTKSFSYCLVDDYELYTFSTLDFNVPLPRDAMKVPLEKIGHHYFVELVKMVVEDIDIPFPFVSEDDSLEGLAIIDTGCTLTFLPDSIYSSLLTAFL